MVMSQPFFEGKKAESLCEKLVNEANAKWMIEDDVIDDTTVLALFFEDNSSS